MARMTNADRLIRTEQRLIDESQRVNESINRLTGINLAEIIEVLQSYLLLQNKISRLLFKVRGELDREGAR